VSGVASNFVSENGVGAVTDANLNTLVQVCNTVATARNFVGQANMEMSLLGYSSPADGGQGIFYWNSTSTAADDGGLSVIRPNGVATGAWLRVSTLGGAGVIAVVAGTALNVGAGPGGTITAAGTLNVNLVAGSGITITNGNTLSAPASGGTVTSIVANNGLSGGTITTAGTVGLAAIAGGDFLANTGTVSAVPTATPMATLTAAGGLSGGPFTPASGGTITLSSIAAGDFLANTGTASATPTATAMATLSVGAGLQYLAGGPYTPAVGGTIGVSLVAGNNVAITNANTVSAVIGVGGTLVTFGTSTLVAGAVTYTLAASALGALSAGDNIRAMVIMSHTSNENGSLAIVNSAGTSGYEVRYQSDGSINFYRITGTNTVTSLFAGGPSTQSGVYASKFDLEIQVKDTIMTFNTLRGGVVARGWALEGGDSLVTLTSGTWYIAVADQRGTTNVYDATMWHNQALV